MQVGTPLVVGAVLLVLILWWLVARPESPPASGVVGEAQTKSSPMSAPGREHGPIPGSSIADSPDLAEGSPQEEGEAKAVDGTSPASDTSSEAHWLTAAELQRPDVQEILSLWRNQRRVSERVLGLLESLGDPRLASRILGLLGEESPKKLWQVLPSRLAAIDPDLAVRVATDMLFSEYEPVRLDAAQTLGEWGSLQDVHSLRQALARPGPISPRESVALAQALDELNSPAELQEQQISRLDALDSGTDEERAFAAAQAMWDDDLPICFMAANDPSALVQGAGMRCLIVMGQSQQAADTVAGWEGVSENVVRGMQEVVDQGGSQ